ncbi:BET1-like protein [Oppia nitens]|uniref:BET1-like protein n=1 Tax=Oppia nitens TaxID=1686743 RepID=UPI0023DA0174|nr:BET1-like protein [Oppia nitens]
MRGDHMSDGLMESDNRQRTDRLAQKISSLKNFAIDIETETKEHNRLLEEVDNDFDSNLGFLTNGRNRVNRLLQSNRQNRRFMCYLSLILTSIFIFMYYLITKSLNTS